jgi:hypothetical protein
MSDYLENNLILHIFRTGSWTKPTDLKLALYTAAPSDSGGGTEVAGSIGYARVSVAPLDANWAATSGINGLTSNVADIVFGAPTGNWGQVTHFGIFDQGTNLLFWGALTTPKTVNSGDPAPKFVAGALTVTLA